MSSVEAALSPCVVCAGANQYPTISFTGSKTPTPRLITPTSTSTGREMVIDRSELTSTPEKGERAIGVWGVLRERISSCGKVL